MVAAAVEQAAAKHYKAKRVSYTAARVWSSYEGARAGYAFALRVALRGPGGIAAAAKIIAPKAPTVALR